jgi:hypothetical protein
MPDRSRKRPRDPNKLAKFIVDVATGARDDTTATPEQQGKNPAAVQLGRLGGLKGGKARASKLSARKRRAIARLAATARWRNGE